MAETLSKFFVKGVDKLVVTEKFNFTVRFEFEEVNSKDILHLNTNKAVVLNSIPDKVLKEMSEICRHVPQQM